MRKFLCLTALCLAMLTASAADFETPRPFTDIGNEISLQQDYCMTDAQVMEYTGYNACDALINLMPVFMDISIEYIHVAFTAADTPLCESVLYASSEPPEYSYDCMNGNAAVLNKRHKRRHC